MRLLTPAVTVILALGLTGCLTPRAKPRPSPAVLDARAHAKATIGKPADRCAGPALATDAPLDAPFPYNKAELTEAGAERLAEAAVWLGCHPAVWVTIEATHDNQGDAAAKAALIAARVATVRKSLEADGVRAERILGYKPETEPTLVIEARGRGW